MKKCLFLDRDGTINVLPEQAYHLDSPEKVVLISGIENLIKKFKDNGYMVIVISNQGGVGKGMYTEQNVKEIEDCISQKLNALNGVTIDDWYYCYHHALGGIGKYKLDCDCRKPSPGNVIRAMEKYGLQRENCFFIGDNITDAKCAENAGIRYFPFDYTGGIKTERGCRIMIKGYSDEKIQEIFDFAENK